MYEVQLKCVPDFDAKTRERCHFEQWGVGGRIILI
jgi:hypothetical protein